MCMECPPTGRIPKLSALRRIGTLCPVEMMTYLRVVLDLVQWRGSPDPTG